MKSVPMLEIGIFTDPESSFIGFYIFLGALPMKSLVTMLDIFIDPESSFIGFGIDLRNFL